MNEVMDFNTFNGAANPDGVPKAPGICRSRSFISKTLGAYKPTTSSTKIKAGDPVMAVEGDDGNIAYKKITTGSDMPNIAGIVMYDVMKNEYESGDKIPILKKGIITVLAAGTVTAGTKQDSTSNTFKSGSASVVDNIVFLRSGISGDIVEIEIQ